MFLGILLVVGDDSGQPAHQLIRIGDPATTCTHCRASLKHGFSGIKTKRVDSVTPRNCLDATGSDRQLGGSQQAVIPGLAAWSLLPLPQMRSHTAQRHTLLRPGISQTPGPRTARTSLSGLPRSACLSDLPQTESHCCLQEHFLPGCWGFESMRIEHMLSWHIQVGIICIGFVTALASIVTMEDKGHLPECA